MFKKSKIWMIFLLNVIQMNAIYSAAFEAIDPIGKDNHTVGWRPLEPGENLNPPILLGLNLETPIVRHGISDYVLERRDQPCKLAIGAGHITDIDKLVPDYQPGGHNELTENIQGDNDFHEHRGWYTFSAETDSAFGSDMVGNIRTLSHQKAIFVPNTWDIIWDESYHPSVLSAQRLFEMAFASLKPGGVFVCTIPIQKKHDYFLTGHNQDKEVGATPTFNEKLAYMGLSERFSSLIAVEDFVRRNLEAIGYSDVQFFESPLFKVLNEVRKNPEEAARENESFAAYYDAIKNTGNMLSQDWCYDCPASVVEFLSSKGQDIEVILYELKKFIASNVANPATNPLLSIDPIFAHTIGMYYVTARKIRTKDGGCGCVLL